jgi:hypothetical protein
MQIENTSVEWDLQEDREILAQFLRTRTGQRLIAKVCESGPVLLGSGDTNSILIRNGEVRGFGAAISALLTLSVVEPPALGEKQVSLYPPVEDDSQWGDGLSLNSNKPPTPNP